MSPVELVDSWGRRFCRGRWGNTRRCRSAGTHATCIKSVFLFLLFLIIYSYFKWVNHLVLRRPQEAGLHPRVAPQPLHNHPQLVRELPVLSWSWCHREELSRIVLRENMSISNQYMSDFVCASNPRMRICRCQDSRRCIFSSKIVRMQVLWIPILCLAPPSTFAALYANYF